MADGVHRQQPSTRGAQPNALLCISSPLEGGRRPNHREGGGRQSRARNSE